MTQSSWLASRWIKRWIKQGIVAACCAFGMAAASAAIVTLTFDTVDDFGPYLDSWTESGFQVTSLEPSGGHLHSGGASLWLHSREGSQPYRFQRIDGGSFDLLSFDYMGGDSVFVTNTGATFTILGDQPLANFSLPAAFHNVSYVDWFMPNPGDLSTPNEQWGNIDNVVTNVLPVPEPAQAAMLALGLAGLLLRARRRQSP